MRMAYKCRAYPDAGQVSSTARTFGCVRKVWNLTLAERHPRYHAEARHFVRGSDAALTAMKKLPSWRS